MYESPIDVFTTQLRVARREFEEKQILEAVQGVGVNVDKEELQKALRYDREQYKKGYADGVKEFAEAYKDQIEDCTGMFTDEGFYIPRDAVLNSIDFIYERMAGES